MKITLLLATYSPNKSEHWRKRWKRQRLEKIVLKQALKIEAKAVNLPCVVTLRRLGPKVLDEDDNLPMSLKSIKDGVADFLIPGLAPGRADGDKRIHWRYDQRIEPIMKVEIEIEDYKD